MDTDPAKIPDMFKLMKEKVRRKFDGTIPNKMITSDPYVAITVCNSVIGRTFVISNCENPVWTQHFYVPIAHSAAEVHFVVKDNDVLGSRIIGVVGIPVEQLLSSTKIEGTFPIIDTNGKLWEVRAVLSLSIQYIPIGEMTMLNSGVPGTYFPLRKGGKVMLYQYANVHDGFLPNLRLDHDMQYKHGNCWRDIFDAISQARRLIYITGWSVYHQVRLVRENDKSAEVTLGELLKTKSQEGVRVLLLVGDDPFSRNILGYHNLRNKT
ncbi:phospholipase D gamma 1-like [Rhododendron vialii]|uniref:phospholipase D gamma 1-like n=1 Tax=Rhododendron vialii TaxID=182163 RepID=UPI00265F005C|nr:phospholipase D gamma 1-like [Rhododendron vialii]